MAKSKERTRTREQELEQRVKALEKQVEQLKEVAYYDELTRESAVLSRYGFMERLKARLTEVDHRNQRGEAREMCVLYIDLDDFKVVNDLYGHEAGDAVLKAFATEVQGVLRGSDIIGRLGGDEFVVLAWVRGEDGSTRLKNRVQQAITLTSVRYRNHEIFVRASIGISTLSPGDSVERLLDRADQLMYEEKVNKKS